MRLNYPHYDTNCRVNSLASSPAKVLSVFTLLVSESQRCSLETGNPKMGTLANSENPDEMPHNAAFYQGLHCFLRKNLTSKK